MSDRPIDRYLSVTLCIRQVDVDVADDRTIGAAHRGATHAPRDGWCWVSIIGRARASKRDARTRALIVRARACGGIERVCVCSCVYARACGTRRIVGSSVSCWVREF